MTASAERVEGVDRVHVQQENLETNSRRLQVGVAFCYFWLLVTGNPLRFTSVTFFKAHLVHTSCDLSLHSLVIVDPSSLL